MKTIRIIQVLTLTVLFSLNIQAQFQGCTTPGNLVTENYSNTTGWMLTDLGDNLSSVSTGCSGSANGYMQFNNNALQFITAIASREMRAYRTIPTLSNTSWTTDFTLTLNNPPAGGLATNAPGIYLAAFTAGTSPIRNSCSGGTQCTSCILGGGGASGPLNYNSTNMDAIWVQLVSPIPANCTSNLTQGTWSFQVASRNGNGNISNSATIPLNGLSTYYIRLERTSAGAGILSVYSNPAMSNHIPGSPICFSLDPGIQNLNVLQQGIIEQGNCMRIVNVSIKNMKIDNGTTCPFTLTPNISVDPSICIGDPIVADGSTSSWGPAPPTQFDWSITESDEFGNEMVGASTWWSQWYQGTPGAFTFPSASNGGPSFIQCGRYYLIKLRLQNCATLAMSTKLIYINCPPNSNAGPDQLICPSGNDGSTTIGGVFDPTLNYSWSPTTGLDNPNFANPSVIFCTGNTVDCIHAGACSMNRVYTLTVTDPSTGCSSSDAVNVTYVQLPPSNATITEVPDLCNGVTLTATSACLTPGTTYLWSPGNETSQSIFVNPLNTTTYSVTMSHPCFSNSSASASVTSHILEGPFPPLSSYAFISPTLPMVIFDDVVYNVYEPYAYNAYEFQLTIYNRVGNVVKTVGFPVSMNSTGFWNGQIQWDGTNQLGAYVNQDVYNYRLKLKNCDHNSCPNWNGKLDITETPDECDVRICTTFGGGSCNDFIDNAILFDLFGSATLEDVSFQDPSTGQTFLGCKVCDYIQMVTVLGSESSLSSPPSQHLTIQYSTPGKPVSLMVTSENELTTQMMVTDMSGKTLLNRKITLEKGGNSISLQDYAFPVGMYLIRLENITETVKMMVTE